MTAKGLHGFAKSKYDPEILGEYIIENLLGIDKMSKLNDKEKESYKKEKYPVVMSFFAQHDLQPTLHNLRLNKQAIIDFANPKAEPEQSNFVGAMQAKRSTAIDVLKAMGFIFILILIIKVL